MDPVILGQKIKEARLAKKMTQSEVVGSFITRNMLSQIESGTATPSMKTLAYLAQVLDLPLSALLADTDTDIEDARPLPELNLAGELQQLRTLYEDRHFSELLDFLADTPEDDFLYSEKAAYHARTAYALALSSEQSGELPAALTYAQEAEKWAGIGFYANPALKADALLLLSRLATELSKLYQH